MPKSAHHAHHAQSHASSLLARSRGSASAFGDVSQSREELNYGLGKLLIDDNVDAIPQHLGDVTRGCGRVLIRRRAHFLLLFGPVFHALDTDGHGHVRRITEK